MNDMDEDPDRLVDTAEAARVLGVKPNTLDKARLYGEPHAIPFVKLGRLVKYRMRDIATHIRLNTHSSTAEASSY